MKRIISLVLVLGMWLSMSAAVFATDEEFIDEDYKTLVIEALNRIESIKVEYGLENVNFESLSIGGILHSYVFTGEDLEEYRTIYPLIYNNELVALAIRMDSGSYQISSDLARDINNVDAQDVAVIYDTDSCWIFDGIDFACIKENMTSIPYRGDLSIDNCLDCINTDAIQLCNIIEAEELEYTSSGLSRNATRSINASYECQVSYVTQLLNGQGSNICWAASAACIFNYINNTNVSAIDVAQAVLGVCCFNRVLTGAEIQDAMRDDLGLWYTFHSAVPSDSVILDNLQRGYPVLGGFCIFAEAEEGEEPEVLGRHAVTVYGIDTSNEYIKVMDPEFGSKIALKEGNKYSYISDYSLVELTFDEALCRWW